MPSLEKTLRRAENLPQGERRAERQGSLREIELFALKHPYRVLILVLGTLGLAGGDLMEVIPLLAPLVASPYFKIFHESHDILALLLVLYAAYRWLPPLGRGALLLFLLAHVPYVALTQGRELPEYIRLTVTVVVAFIAIRLVEELRRLYAGQQDIAKTLQEALLVVPERIEGMDFGHLYHSATEAARVGGDFYDLFELEGGRVGLMIGDISGKGLEAATLTSRVKNTIRAYAESGDSPGTVMARTNDVVRKTFPQDAFVTVFFGVIDTRSGALTYCNAGHPRPLRKRRDEAASPLEATSSLLGAFSSFAYKEGRESLAEGDILLLYTDGLIESRRGKDLFGEERLQDFVNSLHRTASVKDIPQAIFLAVTDFSGGTLSDDLAVVAVSLKRPRPTSLGPEAPMGPTG